MRIREATSHHDLDELTVIQREVWRLEDLDVVGRLQMHASQHAGGSILVAEMDDGTLGGFAHAFPAFVKGETYWHSDMLAVRPSFRGQNVGAALKWAQREEALRQGIARITWTFDPMQAMNAHLNLQVLGATSHEYVRDFYGLTSSALHHGLPTDRLVVSWDLNAPDVAARSRGERVPARPADAKITIPGAWNDLVAKEPGARAEQERVAAEFQREFAKGRAATGFDRTSSSYLLAKPA